MAEISSTTGIGWRWILWAGVLAGSVWVSGCGDKSQPLTATLTFKRDGSHFVGTVVRREANSITITGAAGDTHTFLYSELSEPIKYGTPAVPGTPPSPPGSPGATASVARDKRNTSVTAFADSESVIRFPQGTEFPVRNNGILDSCCLYIGTISLGILDSDIKGSNGKVLIPEGTNVVLVVREKNAVDGRITMQFELGSADFGGRHYTVSSAESALEPGAVVAFSGPKQGTAQAASNGLNLHLDNHTFMDFKTATPTIFRVSE